MRAAFGAGVGILLFGLGACASVEVGPIETSPAPERGVAYGLVKSLTTEVGPRLAGTNAEAAARDWAVRSLTALKFSQVTVEPFTFEAWERGLASATISAPGLPRQELAVVALGRSISTPAKGITAPVAFVASFDDLLSAPPAAYSGKIVFINDRMVRARDGAGYGTAVRKRSRGAVEAAKRGATAVVIRSVGTDQTRFPHTGQMRYEKDVRKIPAAAVSAADADQIERLHAMGVALQLSLKLQGRVLPNAPSGNVVADIVGREKPEEVVLLGAHLDSWDLGTGAVDDAAGVGIVVAAALKAAGPELAPKRTIRVVLYGAEEVGVHGGDAYAKAHAAHVKSHVAAMEADFGTGVVWRYRTKVPESDLAFFDAIGRAIAPLGIERGPNDATGGADIEALMKLGVPIVSLGQDGTTYFDLHHTANDTLDKVDPVALEQCVEAYARTVRMIANR